MAICKVPECRTIILPFNLMCWPHWDMVPRVLQVQIFAARRRVRNRPKCKAYKAELDEANARAIAHVVQRMQIEHGVLRTGTS